LCFLGNQTNAKLSEKTGFSASTFHCLGDNFESFPGLRNHTKCITAKNTKKIFKNKSITMPGITRPSAQGCGLVILGGKKLKLSPGNDK